MNDTIELIDWLQIENDEQIKLKKNTDLVVNSTIDNFESIIESNNEYELNISPLESIQLKSGTIIPKKQSDSDQINQYRYDTYKYFKGVYGDEWINNFFILVNSSKSLSQIDNFTLDIKDIDILEKIYGLFIIELELIGKSNISKGIINILQNNDISLELNKILGVFFYYEGNKDLSYMFLSELHKTSYLCQDKELLSVYIDLNKDFNHVKGIEIYINFYFDIVIDNHEKNKLDINYDNEKFINELLFVYENYIDYYTLVESDSKKIIGLSIKSIELGNTNSNFHLIYGYLLEKDYESASNLYNQWKGSDDEQLVTFTNKSEIEEFYIFGTEFEIEGSINLLMGFYRAEFNEKGYNDEYFDRAVKLANKYGYKFTDKDNVFFDEFTNMVDSLDKEETIIDLIETLFKKYSGVKFALYLDKIYLIITKCLRNRYDNNFEVKKYITLGFENLHLLEEYMSKNGATQDEYLKELREKTKYYSDEKFLNMRFSELLLKFSEFQLKDVDTFHKKLDLPVYLASVFEYYNLLGDMNKALKEDSFFGDDRFVISN